MFSSNMYLSLVLASAHIVSSMTLAGGVHHGLNVNQQFDKRAANSVRTVTSSYVTTTVSYKPTTVNTNIASTGVTTLLPGLVLTFNQLPAYLYLETAVPVTVTTTLKTTIRVTASTSVASSSSATQTSTGPTITSTAVTSASSSSKTDSTSPSSLASSATTATSISSPIRVTMPASIAVVSTTSSGSSPTMTYTPAQLSVIAQCWSEGVPQSGATPQIISEATMNITDCYNTCSSTSNCIESAYNINTSGCMLLSAMVGIVPSNTSHVFFSHKNNGAGPCYVDKFRPTTTYPIISATPAVATASPTGKAIPSKCMAQNIAASPVLAHGWNVADAAGDFAYLYQDNLYGTPMASLQDCCSACAALDSCIAFTYSNFVLWDPLAQACTYHNGVSTCNGTQDAAYHQPSCQILVPYTNGEKANPTKCSTGLQRKVSFERFAGGSGPSSQYGAEEGDFSISGLGTCFSGWSDVDRSSVYN